MTIIIIDQRICCDIYRGILITMLALTKKEKEKHKIVAMQLTSMGKEEMDRLFTTLFRSMVQGSSRMASYFEKA